MTMKKSAATLALAAGLALYAGFAGAESFAIGTIKLSGAMITIEKEMVSASGDARLEMPDASVAAKKIVISLVRGKDGKLGVGKAAASGGVVIHAKQTDKQTKTSRTVDATAGDAETIPADRIVLTGNVKVKITDPDLAEPATLTGEVITVYLKENKIEAKRAADRQAELSLTPKPKKQAEKK